MCRTSKYYIYSIYQDKVNISQVHFCGERTFIRVPKETRLNKYGIPFENPWDVIVKADVIFSNGEIVLKNPEQTEIKILPYDKRSYDALKTLLPNKEIPEVFDPQFTIETALFDLSNELRRKSYKFEYQIPYSYDIWFDDVKIGNVKAVTNNVSLKFLFNGKFYHEIYKVLWAIDDCINKRIYNVDYIKSKYKNSIYQNEGGSFQVFNKLGNVSMSFTDFSLHNGIIEKIDKALEPSYEEIVSTLDAYEILLTNAFKDKIKNHDSQYCRTSRVFMMASDYEFENFKIFIEYNDEKGIVFKVWDKEFPGFSALKDYLLRVYFPEIPENEGFSHLKFVQVVKDLLGKSD